MLPAAAPVGMGSLNDPLNGEKGMLSEGGMHVPFVVSWPGTIPAGQVYDHPISALDVAATAAEIARLETQPADLDGVNLIPHLTGKKTTPPHEVLTWRWVAQSAIREGNWKLLRGGEREYLYDLEADLEEKHNLAAKHPEIATRLRTRLSTWANELDPPGPCFRRNVESGHQLLRLLPRWQTCFAKSSETHGDTATYDWHKTRMATSQRRTKAHARRCTNQSRQTRQTANAVSDKKRFEHGRSGHCQSCSQDNRQGEISFAWRTSEEKEFTRGNRMNVARNHSTDWQTLTATLPGDSKVIHVRMQVPDGTTTIKSIELKPTSGKTATLAE